VNSKIYILVSIILVSVAVLMLNISASGFSIIIHHSYEIGSVRKPRQMEWTTINWGIVIPMITSIATSIFGLAIYKKSKSES